MIDESTRTYLKSKLPEYLRAHGIDPSRSFTCLNPQHRDLGQSMHYNPQTQTLDCPQCQTRYDIFDLVCLEHNLPSLAAAVNYLYDQYLGAEQMPEVAPQAERPSAPAVKTHNVSDFDLDLDNINSLSDDFFAGVTTVAPSAVRTANRSILPKAQPALDFGIEALPPAQNPNLGITPVPPQAPQTPSPMGGFDPFSPVQTTSAPSRPAPKKAPLGDVRVMGPMNGAPQGLPMGQSMPMGQGMPMGQSMPMGQGLPLGQPLKTAPIGTGRNDPFSDPDFIKAQQIKPTFIEPIAAPTAPASQQTGPSYVQPGVPEGDRHSKLNPPNVRDLDHIELSPEEIERRTAEIWGKPNEQRAEPEPEPQSYTIPKNSPYVGAGVQAKSLDPVKRQAQEADASRPEVEMPLRNPTAPSTLINGKAFDFEKKSAAEVQSGIRDVMSRNPPVPQRDSTGEVHTSITASTPQAAAALNPLRTSAPSNGPSTLIQRSAPVTAAPATDTNNPYAKAFAALNATNENTTRISGYSSALHGNQPAQAPTVNTMISSEPVAQPTNAPKGSVFNPKAPGTTVFGLDAQRHTSTLMSDNRGRVLTDDFGHRVHEDEISAAKVAAARSATFDFLHPNKAAAPASADASSAVAANTAAASTAAASTAATSTAAVSAVATSAVATLAPEDTSSIILGATVATEPPEASAHQAAVPASVQKDIKALNQAANAIFSALSVPESSAQSVPESSAQSVPESNSAASAAHTPPAASGPQAAPQATPAAQPASAPQPVATAQPAAAAQATSTPQPVATAQTAVPQPTVVAAPKPALNSAAQPTATPAAAVTAVSQPPVATMATPKKVKPEFFAAEEAETKILEVNPLEERPHSSAPELAPLSHDLDLPDVAKLDEIDSDFEDDLESSENPLASSGHKDPGFTLSEDDLELEAPPKSVDAFSTLTATANARHPQAGLKAPGTPFAPAPTPKSTPALSAPSVSAPAVPAPNLQAPAPAVPTAAAPAVHGGDVVLVPQSAAVLPTQLKGTLSHYLQRCKDAVGACGYFAAQGLSASLIERYSLGFDPSYRVESTFTPGSMESWQPQLWQAAIIPLNEDSYVALDINSVDPLHPDKRYVGQERCFNLNILSEVSGPLLVCASELDALALLSLNVPAIALGAPQHTGVLLDALLNSEVSASHLYLSLPQEPGWNEVRDFLLRELSSRQIAVHALDLTYPYGSIAQALSQDPQSLNQKLNQLTQISDVTLQTALTPQTLSPNHLVLSLEALARLELSPMMYAISSPAVALSRLVLASLIENKQNAILYAGSKMQWQMICSLLTFNLTQYGPMAGYQARLLELPVEQSAAMLEATLNHGLVAARLSGMAPTLMVDTFAFDHSMCSQLSPRLAQLATEFQVPVVVWCSFEQQSIFEGNALQTLAINQGNDNELIFTTLDSSCRLHSFSTKQG